MKIVVVWTRLLCLLAITCFGVGCSGTPSLNPDATPAPRNALSKAAIGGPTIAIGETTILSGTDSGNGNVLLVQDVSLPQTATIQSLSFYVRTASGNLVLGIYDSSGSGSGPGVLKAQTNSFTPVAGWNTISVTNQILLTAGNYWLAYLPSSGKLKFAANFSTGSYKAANISVGPMPTTFPSITGQGSTHWSIYATLNTGGTPDTLPPTTSITAPAAGGIVSGTTTVTASASDNVGVAGVQFLLDGVSIGAEDTTSPYSIAWNTTTAPTGPHIIAAQARDAAGNVTTSTPINITVNNQAPTGTIVINNDDIATNSRNVILTLCASDATQMRISNTATAGTAEAFATSKAWTLTSGAGTKTSYVQYKNAAGNWSGNIIDTIILDTTAPTISAVASSITGNSATITWTTDESATSQVEYGLTTSYGTLTAIDANLTTNHNVILTGLTPNTTYNYRVRSKDAASNEKIYSNKTFKTLNVTDSTPPSVPTDLTATSVSMVQVNLSWTASTDNIGVAGYYIFRNGTQIAAVTSGTLYSDTDLISNTTYSYTISAYDAVGNHSAQTLPVYSTTPADTSAPSVPQNLTATPVSSTQVNLTWRASTDNLAVTGYNVFRDGIQVATPTSTFYSDTGLTKNTTHSYTVAAHDAAGNISAESSIVSFTTLETSSTATPTVVQHVASSANPEGLGIAGNNFKIPLPNSVGAGNCLILGMTYPHGSIPTITDNNGNLWPTTAAVLADAGNGGYVASIWVLPNVNAGQTVITVSFAAAVIPFNYTLSEFNNVSAISPVNGTAATADEAGASLTTGALTPGDNNINGGNLIWNYYAISGPARGNPTSWVTSGGFTLLDADIAWNTKQGFPHASQYAVQTTANPINPGIVATMDTSDNFNAVAVALKAAQAGTAIPNGIHINKIIHQTSNVPPTSTWTVQIPATGNLRVLATANGIMTNITSITDSDGGTWVKVQPSADEPQIWYSANTSADPNLSVALHLSAGPTATIIFYDISGAATSPFDVASGAPSTGVSNQSTISYMPVITPTTANGLVIVVMGDGNGPVLGLDTGSPSGAIFDIVNYTGEIDVDLMENADGQAHIYNSDTNVENWNWRITSNPNNSVDATAVAFKSQ